MGGKCQLATFRQLFVRILVNFHSVSYSPLPSFGSVKKLKIGVSFLSSINILYHWNIISDAFIFTTNTYIIQTENVVFFYTSVFFLF